MNRCLVRKTLSWGICAFMLTGSALAQNASEEVSQSEAVRVEDVVISATKTEIPLSQVTSAVEVISGADLQERKIRTVADALRFAQGLAVFSSGGPGTETTVRMRGAQSRHTLVLIDGTIVNSPTTGAFNFANLLADNIERIEILRGAQSMLYGSDAIGGVINIITKRGTGRPTASAFAEYGSFLSIREGAQFTGASGVFDYSFSLSRWDTSSFSAINYRRGATERDRFGNWQGSSRIGMSLPKDGRLDFNLRWWETSVHFDGFAGSGAPADILGARNKTSTLIVSGSYEQPLTTWWTQRLTVAQGHEQLTGESGTAGRNLVTGAGLTPDPFCFSSTCFFARPVDIAYTTRRLEWQHVFQVIKDVRLVTGYQFREEIGDAPASFSPDQPTRLLSSHAGFADAQASLFDRLLLTAGVRHDRFNVFGDATTYRLTAGYLLHETGTKLRGSVATGFRAPTLNDLFFQGFGNPNLKPEESQSFDVAVDQQLFQDRLQLSVGYFRNEFTNLVVFAASPTCPAVTFGFCPLNIGEARSQGIEASARLSVTERLSLRGHYTYTATRDLATHDRLPRWPVHQASVIASYYPLRSLNLSAEYRYVGARFNDTSNTQKLQPFGVVNLVGTYDVSRHVQVYARVENLFNEQYEEILFFGTPIRSVFGGVKLIL